jgi:hypothetical protein
MGVAAGKMTKSNSLGFIVGVPIGYAIGNVNSFELGARSVNPDAPTRVVVTGGWADKAKEAAAANALIDLLAPPGRQASAFGLSGSAMALAFATGPLSGGAVASAFGLHAGFVVVGVMLLLLSVAVVLFVGEPAAAGVGRTVEAGE